MPSLKEIFIRAIKEKWATGHFNASELDQMRVIVEACKDMGAPAIIGTSEGERKHLGLLEAVAVRDALAKEYGILVFLNADHTKSVAVAKDAIDAGYDSIHIDLSTSPLEDNVKGTKEIVLYARKINPAISVEGELGYLRGESKVQKEKIELKPEDYTNPEEAEKFVKETEVERLAIAVGNIHGISLDEPDIDIERVKNIRKAVSQNVALVLHAGSGIPDEQIKAAIKAGIANIHINTDLRVAFVKELKRSLAEHLDEVAMYKLDASANEAMKQLVIDKLKLFGSVNRI